MAKHRVHSLEFKRRVAQEFLAGETLRGLAKRYDLSRNLVRVWVQKFEDGALNEDAVAGDMVGQYEARIAALERRVGKQALELEFLKGGSEQRSAAEKRAYIRDCRPAGLSIAEGCRLMGIARSTYYDAAPVQTDDTEIVEAIAAIRDEFEFYDWRRVRAALQQRGMIVNHKKIKRLMREHDLQPGICRHHVATTDSDHDQPIFPDREEDDC
jgi:transposase-like protein